MQPSLFLEYVKKFFAGVVVMLIKKINEKPYYFKSMLSPDESVDGTWKSLSENNQNVAADVVALDSPLPLKSRPPLAQATGDIPKIGMKKKLNENQLKALQILIALGRAADVIARSLFKDTGAVIKGVYERLEYMLLQGLSTGMTEHVDPNNVGIGIRINYNIPAGNKFGALTAAWGSVGSNPLNDIRRVITAASLTGGVTKIMMDWTAFNNLAQSDGGKGLYASSIGFAGASIPTPTLEAMNKAMKANFSVEIEIVDKTTLLEKNGVITPVKPWKVGAVTFLLDNNVGTLAYSQVAEDSFRIGGVEYAKADNYILVSKYGSSGGTDTLTEVTASQAQALPVLQNVNTIYILDTTTIQA